MQSSVGWKHQKSVGNNGKIDFSIYLSGKYLYITNYVSNICLKALFYSSFGMIIK